VEAAAGETDRNRESAESQAVCKFFFEFSDIYTKIAEELS